MFLTAGEAAARLNITLPTLYAYVSRGLLKSESRDGSRRRAYRVEDVEALAHQRQRRRQPDEALQQALHFGEPLLDSQVSEVTSEGPLYRGHRAVALAADHTYESVVALLWDVPQEDLFSAPAPTDDLRPVRNLPPLLALQTLLPLLTCHDDHAYDFRPDTLHRIGVRILRLLAALATNQAPAATPVAPMLAEAWGCPASARRWFDAALILCADHELNVSTFTARCVASADAPLYAAINGALSAFQGHKHGAQADKVYALWAEVQQEQSVRQAVLNRVKRGDALPGFGHPLYPEGDPRAAALLAGVPVKRARLLADTVFELTGQRPNLDFALVALTRHYNLPARTSGLLFAQGRLAGWVAHAVEQYGQDRMIRPRARKHD